MGRIDRVALDGRVREWRAPRIACDEHEGVETTVVPDPRGGIAYASRGLYGGGSGRVRAGRRERFPSFGAGTFTRDGALWRSVPTGVERRAADGRIATFQTPRGLTQVSAPTPTRDGGVAVVRASYWRSYGGDAHSDPVSTYLDARLTLLAPDGSQTDVPLPDSGTDAFPHFGGTSLTLGPDGAFYLHELRVGADEYHLSTQLLRVLPDGAMTPRPPDAAVQRVLGRVGRTLWLQVGCDADAARFCSGSVTLAGMGMTDGAGPFALAGGVPGAVPVTLGSRALETLRRRGSVHATVVVAPAGAAISQRTVTVTRRGVR